MRKTWSDGKNSMVEDKLGEFVVVLFKHAKLNKERKLREEAEALEREKQRKLKRYKEACDLLEKQMLEELSIQSNNLNKSRELLAYIDEVKSLAKKHYGDQDYSPELTNWITWAENHAKELNPLTKGILPSYKKATEIIKL